MSSMKRAVGWLEECYEVGTRMNGNMVMTRMLSLGAVLWLGCAAPVAAPAEKPATNAETNGSPSASAAPGQGTSWFAMSVREFEASRAAKAPLDFEKLDQDLLSAALLHESNRRRTAQGLPALKDHPKARAAAATHARSMAKHQFIDHLNPHSREARELPDRIRLAGMDPSHAAENLAMGFGWQYEGGRDFYTRIENGKEVYSYTADGPPIPRHTYLSFAKDVVDQWMNSPVHRKNLLDARVEYVGAVGYLAEKNEGMEEIYCVQVFFGEADR